MDGLLILDKPAGITSRAAVNRVQRWLPRGTRLGHTGTLDPLATGVLVLCVGPATRLAEYVQRMAKTYRAGIILGARSDTDDADGTITPAEVVDPPTLAALQAVLPAFVGTIAQVPPAYSAAKVAGRRAYALARRGDAVELTPRLVTLYTIAVVSYAYPRLELSVHCSKGTYIRALARDLGERLGCGGYIAELRRTQVGCFDAAAALSLDVDAATARAALLPSALALSDLPRRTIVADEIARIRQGQPLTLLAEHGAAAEVALFDEANALIAVGVVDAAHGLLRPAKVFSPV